MTPMDADDWKTDDPTGQAAGGDPPSGCSPMLTTSLGCLGLLVLVAFIGFPLWMKWMDERSHQQRLEFQRQLLEKYLSGVRTGTSDMIYLYGTKETDELLKTIVGIPGIREVSLHITDATDEGMKYIATLPDLRRLRLQNERTTDVGLQELVEHPTLEALYLDLPSPARRQMTVSAILALPHLRKLEIYDGWPGNGLLSLLPDLEQATALEELSLIDGGVTETHAAALRQKLPNCKVFLQSEESRQRRARKAAK
jgi:hypothetical protein